MPRVGCNWNPAATETRPNGFHFPDGTALHPRLHLVAMSAVHGEDARRD